MPKLPEGGTERGHIVAYLTRKGTVRYLGDRQVIVNNVSPMPPNVGNQSPTLGIWSHRMY